MALKGCPKLTKGKCSVLKHQCCLHPDSDPEECTAKPIKKKSGRKKGNKKQ